MAFYSLIACTEKNGSRNEDYGLPLTGTSRVTLLCSWANSIALVSDILDNRRSDPFHVGLFASQAHVQALGGENAGYTVDGVSSPQIIVPNSAEVTITYGTLDAEERDANPTGDPNAEWYTENVEPTAEFMTLDHRDFRWAPAGGGLIRPLKPEEAPGRIMLGCKLVRNFRNLSALPVGTFTLMGRTNIAAYTSTYLDGEVFAIDTLLYQPPVLTRTVKRNGTSTWDLRLSFHYKEHTWNKFWHAEEGDYLELYHVTDLGTPYRNHKQGDLSTLLT